MDLKSIIASMSGIFAQPASQIETDLVNTNDAFVLTHHKDMTVTDITDTVREAATLMAPFRRTGVAALVDPQSVCNFVNRFKDEGTAIFVDPGDIHLGGSRGPRMDAVINYHLGGPEVIDGGLITGGRSNSARHGDFGATYDFPMTEAFRAWVAASKKGFTQEGLGVFLLDRVEDFDDPTPALVNRDRDLVKAEWENDLLNIAERYGSRFGSYRDLMALSQSFEVNENSTMKITRNQNTGESQFEFKNEHSGAYGSRIDVPTLFIAMIQVYSGGPLYRVPVRLAYRKEGQKVSFFLSIARLSNVMERATKQLVDQVAEGMIEPGPQIFWGRVSAR